MASRYYDRAGNPISLTQWALEIERQDNQVARDTVGPWLISTVWLGINHNFVGTGSPLIFETMIFGPSPFSDEQYRWTTEDEARSGHVELVSRCERAV